MSRTAFTLILLPIFSHSIINDYAPLNQSRENVDFCHINDFNSLTDLTFEHIVPTPGATPAVLLSHMERGEPFVVSGVTEGWRAREKWSETYFEEIFANVELFSSTFATNMSPVFQQSSRKDIYYGIFLNDRGLAEFLSKDYTYPNFVPHRLKIQGFTEKEQLLLLFDLF